nr:hypothetical protein [Frigidibacter mobilis]
MALAILLAGETGPAAACIPPRPFLPQSEEHMQLYTELIRHDFETYITTVQDYFRCLDEERARAFAEAHEVSADYERFISAVE